MTLKRTSSNPGAEANGNGAATSAQPPVNTVEQQKFRENPEVNAKIDSYIQQNPREWAYIQNMPRERLERSIVLQAVQKVERQEKMRAGILKRLDENPELKEAYRNLVKNLPADQQETAIATLAMRTMRMVAPPQAPQQAQGAKV